MYDVAYNRRPVRDARDSRAALEMAVISLSQREGLGHVAVDDGKVWFSRVPLSTLWSQGPIEVDDPAHVSRMGWMCTVCFEHKTGAWWMEYLPLGLGMFAL